MSDTKKAIYFMRNYRVGRTLDGVIEIVRRSLLDLAQKLEIEVRYMDRESEIENLRAALEFYADKFNWRTNSGKVGITPLTNGDDAELIDGQWTNGKRARKALTVKT